MTTADARELRRTDPTVIARLRQAIRRSGKRQGDIAADAGLSSTQLSTRLSGHTRFSVAEVEALCLVLGENPVEVMFVR